MEPTPPEPSMEDILASIKRIIAEDGDPALSTRTTRPRREPISFDDDAAMARPEIFSQDIPSMEPPQQEEHAEDVLELTSSIGETPREAAPVKLAAKLVSDTAASASRQALDALSALIVKPEPGSDNTLEGMVRELLRPVLKEWLDAKLPDIVERMVASEISRITGRVL